MESAQLFGLMAMISCLVVGVAVVVSPSFSARTLQLQGAVFTSPSIVRSILGMDSAPNLFRIETDTAAEKLARLPAVESAVVHVQMPSTVIVELVERQPKIVWVLGGSRYVADEDGFLFGLIDSAGNPIPSDSGPLSSPTPVPTPSRTPRPSPTPTPEATPDGEGDTPTHSPTESLIAPPAASLAPAPTPDSHASAGSGALALPVVFDRRKSSAGWKLGSIVDATSLDAGYRIGNLQPIDVGSRANSLAVVLDDYHGFTVSPVGGTWVAEFGFYAPTVRKVTVIPEQVRDLRSVLGQIGEDKVAWVFLVADVSDHHTFTYIPRTPPAATPTPKPSARK